jgi:hypothetical protein
VGVKSSGINVYKEILVSCFSNVRSHYSLEPSGVSSSKKLSHKRPNVYITLERNLSIQDLKSYCYYYLLLLSF